MPGMSRAAVEAALVVVAALGRQPATTSLVEAVSFSEKSTCAPVADFSQYSGGVAFVGCSASAQAAMTSEITELKSVLQRAMTEMTRTPTAIKGQVGPPVKAIETYLAPCSKVAWAVAKEGLDRLISRFDAGVEITCAEQAVCGAEQSGKADACDSTGKISLCGDHAYTGYVILREAIELALGVSDEMFCDSQSALSECLTEAQTEPTPKTFLSADAFRYFYTLIGGAPSNFFDFYQLSSGASEHVQHRYPFSGAGGAEAIGDYGDFTQCERDLYLSTGGGCTTAPKTSIYGGDFSWLTTYTGGEAADEEQCDGTAPKLAPGTVSAVTPAPTAPTVYCDQKKWMYSTESSGWGGLDMPGQGRSWEASAANCNTRCANTADCAYFTYWPDGGCHLSNAQASQRISPWQGPTNNVLGPSGCV